MLQKLRKHIANHQGDANVSRMTMIAIVFVVGAILLVMTTSAFRNPINRWFKTVSNDWFDGANGEYNLSSQLYMYDRNENGTYQGVQYVHYFENGQYEILKHVENATNGTMADWGTLMIDWYNADGQFVASFGSNPGGNCSISEDGTRITVDNIEYVVQPTTP